MPCAVPPGSEASAKEQRLLTSSAVIPPPWSALLAEAARNGLAVTVRQSEVRIGEAIYYNTTIHCRADAVRTDGHVPPISFARGVALDRNESYAKAFGEFLERYPLALYHKNELREASPRELESEGAAHIDLEQLAGFTEEQRGWYPSRRFTNESRFLWARMDEIQSGRNVLAPAQLIFWNYCRHGDTSIEPALREPNTSGAAGFYTREGALLAAVYELVQRDGFITVWLRGDAFVRISTDNDRELQELIRPAQDEGLEVVFLDTTSDLLIPSCVCVLIDQSGKGPWIAMGGGCSLDGRSALRRSFVEAVGIRYWIMRYPGPAGLPEPYVPFRTPVDQAARLHFWALQQGQPPWFRCDSSVPLNRFLAGDRKYEEDRQELEFLASHLRSFGKGYEILAFFSPLKLLRDFGFHSVRAVIPALTPFYIHEENAPLGGQRVKPRKAGRIFGATDFNPIPHPFP